MGNIQHHIDWKIRQRDVVIKYNEMATQCKSGIFDMFEKDMESVTNQEYKEKRLQDIIKDNFREVPELIPQVTLDQVKEKFGTLRFYYTGGDDYISGLVSMAESMSGVLCETCGKPGTSTRGGWIKTACKEHGGIDYEESEEDYLKQGYEE
jgi:cell division ATPase FtsA